MRTTSGLGNAVVMPAQPAPVECRLKYKLSIFQLINIGETDNTSRSEQDLSALDTKVQLYLSPRWLLSRLRDTRPRHGLLARGGDAGARFRDRLGAGRGDKEAERRRHRRHRPQLPHNAGEEARSDCHH